MAKGDSGNPTAVAPILRANYRGEGAVAIGLRSMRCAVLSLAGTLALATGIAKADTIWLNSEKDYYYILRDELEVNELTPAAAFSFLTPDP